LFLPKFFRGLDEKTLSNQIQLSAYSLNALKILENGRE